MARPKERSRIVILLVEDDSKTRKALTKRLQKEDFEVTPTDSYDDALSVFRAGLVDAVVADWDLAPGASKKGDALFEELRKRDCEVPLVLVSGKLTEERQRARTLQRIIEYGPVRFVERAQGYGYTPIVHAVRDLLARRDVVMQRLIGRLRESAERGEIIKTTSGALTAEQILSKLVSSPDWKSSTLSPLAEEFIKWEEPRLKRRRS